MRMVKALAIIAVGLCAAAAGSEPYLLIPGTFEKGRQPDGNSIILDAPKGLIVIDTGRHKAQQDKILGAAKARTKPIVAIINSHWHLDHTGGNAGDPRRLSQSAHHRVERGAWGADRVPQGQPEERRGLSCA